MSDVDGEGVREQGKGNPLPCSRFRHEGGLVAEGVVVSRGGFQVLRGVDFSVASGEIVALVGPNGSGKSSLLLTLKGALRPGRGRVLAAGEPLAAFDPRVGLVLSNPEDQGVAPIVEDDVAFGAECLGLDPTEVDGRVNESLRAVGLDALRGASIHTLSGGQGQQLALAAVLALGAKWLLLDEATAMLSPWERDGFLMTVTELKAKGVGVVQVTHQSEELLWADRVVSLEQGAVVFDGPVEGYFTWPGCSLPVPAYEVLRRAVEATGTVPPPFLELAAWLAR